MFYLGQLRITQCVAGLRLTQPPPEERHFSHSYLRPQIHCLELMTMNDGWKNIIIEAVEVMIIMIKYQPGVYHRSLWSVFDLTRLRRALFRLQSSTHAGEKDRAFLRG